MYINKSTYVQYLLHSLLIDHERKDYERLRFKKQLISSKTVYLIILYDCVYNA